MDEGIETIIINMPEEVRDLLDSRLLKLPNLLNSSYTASINGSSEQYFDFKKLNEIHLGNISEILKNITNVDVKRSIQEFMQFQSSNENSHSFQEILRYQELARRNGTQVICFYGNSVDEGKFTNQVLSDLRNQGYILIRLHDTDTENKSGFDEIMNGHIALTEDLEKAIKILTRHPKDEGQTVLFSENPGYKPNNINSIYIGDKEDTKTWENLFDLLNKNQIPEVPKITITPYIGRNEGTRTDPKITRVLYALRDLAKTIPDRELRNYVYKKYLMAHCGDLTRIGSGVEIRFPERLYVGDNIQINDGLFVQNEGPVVIGDNSMFAVDVKILTHYHNLFQGIVQDETPNWQKGDTRTMPVSIEDNVWISTGSVVEAGTYIGHSSIVLPNAVVRSGIYPPYSLIAGNPGKIIRSIKKDIELWKNSYELIKGGF